MNIQPKLLILDLDGTVVPIVKNYMGLPSERVIQAISDARRRGVHVCIATGRPLMKALPLLEKLGIQDPCIVGDGAVIFDPLKKEFINKRLVSPEKIDEVATKLGDAVKYYHIQNMEGEHLYSPSIDKTDISGMTITGIPLEECEAIHEKIKEVESLAIRRITKTWGGGLFILTDIQATKQVAVLHLMEYFKVKPEEIIAVGDSENDIPMILAAGIGIAMGNSSEGLKSIADDVCPSVEDDGVAFVIEKYFPNK